MVLVAAGPYFAEFLRDSYRSVLKALIQANMQVNPTKTVVNVTRTKQKLGRVWRSHRLPPEARS
eukprot:5988418-Amphidinium_carterae.1